MNSLAYEALVLAAIVCYYRPFSQNEKKSNPKALSKLCISDFLPLSEKESELHQCCQKLRNKALAHSEFDHNPTKLNKDTGVIKSKPFSLLSHAPDLNDLIDLANKLAIQCNNKRANYVSKNVS